MPQIDKKDKKIKRKKRKETKGVNGMIKQILKELWIKQLDTK